MIFNRCECGTLRKEDPAFGMYCPRCDAEKMAPRTCIVCKTPYAPTENGWVKRCSCKERQS